MTNRTSETVKESPHAEANRLARDNKRLRNALRFIRDLEPGSRGAYGKFKEAQNRARLALAGKEPEPPSFSPNFDERNGI